MSFPRSLLLLLPLFALPLFAGDNHWTVKGPDGGTVSKVAFDPADATIAYAASDNGIFRSSDSGIHWTAAAELLGTSVTDVAVASADPQKVFASAVYGLFKSSDRGATWHVVHPFASYKVAVSRNGDVVYSLAGSGPIHSTDGGVTFDSTGAGLPPQSSISALVVDPQNSNTAYVSFFSTAGVYKTIDGGAHWTASNSGLSSAFYYTLAIDPSNSSTLYVGPLNRRIYKSTDAGASWAELTNGLGSSAYHSIAICASAPNHIVAATDEGIYRSVDGGASWNGPVKPTIAAVIAIDPQNANNVLIVANLTVYKSVNEGVTSSPAGSGLSAFYTAAIATDPVNPSIVYASGPSGIFKSTDRGDTWTSLFPNFCLVLAADPFNSSTLYGSFGGSVRRSTDGGSTWQDFRTGLPNTVSLIAPDPLVQGTIYAIAENAIYRKDGNNDWVNRSTGLPATTLSFIVIDPNNSSTLYTGGASGVFKSTNGGASWSAANGGLGTSVNGVSVDRFDSNHLLTWQGSSAYESVDGGANWTPFTIAANRQAIRLAFDPTAPGRIYNSTYDGTGSSPGARIDRSNDGGKTWSQMQSGLGRNPFQLFVIAPGGNVLYGGGASGGVWSFHFARARAVSH